MQNSTISDIERELEWEQDMVNRGAARFMAAAAKDRAAHSGEQTTAGRNLLNHYLSEVADGISDYISPGGKKHKTSDREIMRAIDPQALAMITLKVILSDLHNTRKSIVSAAQDVGHRLEDEILMQKFHAENAAYFEEIERRIENKQSYSREYKRNSIIGSFRKQGVEYAFWEPIQRYRIGLRCIQIAASKCDLFTIVADRNRKRGSTFLVPTDETLEWIKNHDEAMALIFPDRMPMIIPPQDWVDAENGGYYLPHLRAMTPLIIKSPLAIANGNKWLKMYNEANMPGVYSAVNSLQRSEWKINTRVLEVLQSVMHNNMGIGVPPSEPLEFPECPLPKDLKSKDVSQDSEMGQAFVEWKAAMRILHELEGERKAKLIGTLRTLRMAHAMSHHDKFYFVYRTDFRGRVYSATSGLSPQGTEISKALLKAYKAKPLGEDGWFWLRVSGANRYGKDKVSFEDRVKWIDDHRENWLLVAGDPLAHHKIWSEASEPYQFLAWCFEYAEALMVGPHEYRSSLPIGMDGSCNGLQHFSAMLRDSVGGEAVNLTYSDVPKDIYQWVGDVLTDKLRALAPVDAAAANWLALVDHMGLNGIPRGLPKPPVMTLPYGSTQQACTDSVYAWYMREGRGFFPKGTDFKHALYLSPLLWDSIGEVVIAARAAMRWIRQVTKLVVKEGKFLTYTSPLGFPVKQRTEKRDRHIITTYLSGEMRVAVTVPNGELDPVKMQNGSAPNFVHQCDASHLMMTTNELVKDDIDFFAMVHDEYGTLAADVPKMMSSCRRMFHHMYTSRDPLLEFKRELEAVSGIDLPDPPPCGSLDISEVLRSRYFFS